MSPAAALSATPLARLFLDEIHARGPLPFARYMEWCLYHPQHGFYARTAGRVGRRGDFFTSISVGAVFGELIATFVARRWETLGRPDEFSFIEQGANNGQLTADVLRALAREAPELLARITCVIVEPLPVLRQAQETMLEEWAGQVCWVDPLVDHGPRPSSGGPAESNVWQSRTRIVDPLPGVFFVNEVLDAFPVERIQFDGSQWRRLFVDVAPNGQFIWHAGAIADASLEAFARSLGTGFPAGYTTEYCPGLAGWVADASRAVTSGAILVTDYGRECADYFAPERSAGTLRGFRKHRRCDDPFDAPGETDLTADVNFTALADAAHACGLQAHPPQRQEAFLTQLAAERIAAIEHTGLTPASRRWLRQFQTLTHPGFMGRAFHAVILEKKSGVQ